MKGLLIIAVGLNIISCYAQDSELNLKTDNLKQITTMPYNPELSGDSLFWMVVKEGMTAVPYLIDKLDDTTMTEASVSNFGGNYTVADIAYEAILIIIQGLPTLEFAEDSLNPEPRDGYWGYWNYTRRSYENRVKFKNRVNEWYTKNKGNLIWIEYTRNFRTAPDWKFDKNRHPLGGYYKLKE